jgi:uncharacterized lipoprotein YajG
MRILPIVLACTFLLCACGKKPNTVENVPDSTYPHAYPQRISADLSYTGVTGLCFEQAIDTATQRLEIKGL